MKGAAKYIWCIAKKSCDLCESLCNPYLEVYNLLAKGLKIAGKDLSEIAKDSWGLFNDFCIAT